MAEPTQDYPTILGPDATFKGELSFDKGMRIHGKMEGKIQTAGKVLIAKEAKLVADIEAGAILVEGEVRGNLSASERVELKNTARYEGDLRASKLIVEEGAIFSGHVSVGPEAAKGQTRPAGAQAQPARPSPSPVSVSVGQQAPQPARVG